MAPTGPARLSDEATIKFLIEVIKSAKTFEPEFSTVAISQGINTAQNAQRRFKSIVEKAGYNCTKNIITDKSTDPTTPPTASAAIDSQIPETSVKKTPASKKRGAPSVKKSISKKQKKSAEKVEETQAESGDEDNGSGLEGAGDLEA